MHSKYTFTVPYNAWSMCIHGQYRKSIRCVTRLSITCIVVSKCSIRYAYRRRNKSCLPCFFEIFSDAFSLLSIHFWQDCGRILGGFRG